jgi:O-methyltransferase/methyltransferase family protein
MTDETQTLPPHAQLVQMAMAHWGSHILYVAAKLGLADHLANGPLNAEQLAERTSTHAPSLYRLMRTLAGYGILTEDNSRRFSLTSLGEAMKTGAPGAARATILTIASPWWTAGFAELMHSVQTGKPGFEKMAGMAIFDWLAENPEQASLFNETMVGIHGAEPPAIAAAYDFSGVKKIVDVGGGSGNLLTTIVAKFPESRGILFDMPHVIRDGAATIKARGLTDRITIEQGSFFETVPAGGDVYILSHIIHDWSEDLCLKIFGNCTRVMNPDTRLLIIEMVLPSDNTPHPGKILDMMMLVGPGGQERTVEEYDELLSKAGLRITQVVPTVTPVSVIEAKLK